MWCGRSRNTVAAEFVVQWRISPGERTVLDKRDSRAHRYQMLPRYFVIPDFLLEF